jgi:hypothetical protein
LYKQAAIYAMEMDKCSVDEICLHVNHADADPTNNFAYNLEWTVSWENRRHIELAKLVPPVDSKGKKNIISCAVDTGIGGKLRAGIYMSAQRVPEAFGNFLTNGANGAFYNGEPYAKYISRAIDNANLQVGIATIHVKGKNGKEHFIEVAGRTVWQIIGDMWAVKAVEIIGAQHGIGFENGEQPIYVDMSVSNDTLLDTSNLHVDLQKHIKALIRETLKSNMFIRVYLDSGTYFEIPPSHYGREMKSVFSSTRSFIRIDEFDVAGSCKTLYTRPVGI